MNRKTGFRTNSIPVIAIAVAFAGIVGPVVLASAPEPSGGNCASQCARLPEPFCGANMLPCCCKIGGTWKCVCRLLTDCTTQYGCIP